MSNHVTEWLNAYFDGELTGRRLDQVEEHLAACETCQAELDSLQDLSELLREVPVPELISPERFAVQVGLRLSRREVIASKNGLLEIGWWMIPVGLLAAWVFISTSLLVNGLLSTANSLGLLTSISSWMMFGTSNVADWSSTLGQIGVLSGRSLDLAASTETLARLSLPQITLQISIALLYLSWIAIWWTRQTRQQQSQPIEG
jgi:hypothetical protein